MKKKLLRVVLILAIIGSLAACNSTSQKDPITDALTATPTITTDKSSDATSTDDQTNHVVDPLPTNSQTHEPSQAEKEGPTLNSKVIEVSDTSLLLTNMGDNTSAGDLYFVSLKDIPLYDQEGVSLSSKDLKAGMLLNVYYDGTVLESYPSQIANVSSIYVTEEDYDMVGFYLDVIQDIYEEDEGLNNNINKIALDLTNTENISESEKRALAYITGNEYSFESFLSTFEELKENGYIKEDELYFPDGILITIEATETKNDKFTFSISKWRSGKGAIGHNGNEATYKDGDWTYTLGSSWIS